MNSVFLDYSKYYDTLYKDKDYKSEAEFVIKLIKKYNPNAKTVLNIGCGTGSHDIYFREAGYKLTGIDISEEMIQIAQNKENGCEYFHGDARDLNLQRKFDVVISLFHVLSYQNNNDDVVSFMTTINKSLNINGIAIFDYWYGPAVLNLKPENRTKRFDSNELIISRHAKTKLNTMLNVASVIFDIEVENKLNNTKVKLNEVHEMRYFFTPELELFIKTSNLKTRLHSKWMELSVGPDEFSWGVFTIVSN